MSTKYLEELDILLAYTYFYTMEESKICLITLTRRLL